MIPFLPKRPLGETGRVRLSLTGSIYGQSWRISLASCRLWSSYGDVTRPSRKYTPLGEDR